MKIRPVVAELFHANRRTDRRDEAESLFAILWTHRGKKNEEDYRFKVGESWNIEL